MKEREREREQHKRIIPTQDFGQDVVVHGLHLKLRRLIVSCVTLPIATASIKKAAERLR